MPSTRGFGDVFVTSITGNVADLTIIGSLEFGWLVLGAKVHSVLGHSSRGAVEATLVGDAVPGQTSTRSQHLRPAVRVSPGRLDTASLHASLDTRATTGCADWVRATAQRLGRIDALVDNAGVAREAMRAMGTDEVIGEVRDVNLRTPLELARAVVRVMLAQRPGAKRLINVSSIIGQRGVRGRGASAAPTPTPGRWRPRSGTAALRSTPSRLGPGSPSCRRRSQRAS